MIINENLSTQDKIILTAKDVDARFASVFIDNLGLVDGETYTFSGNLNLSEGETSSVILFDSNYKVQSGISTFSTKERSSFSFTYRDGVTSRIACYAGVHGSTSGISARYTNIKLEKGEEKTLYIPNKNTLETAKRPYFIGGGYVQRGLSSRLEGVLYAS